MSPKRDIIGGRFKECCHGLPSAIRWKIKALTHQIVKVALPLALLSVMSEANVQAAPPGHKATMLTRSSTQGPRMIVFCRGKYRLSYVVTPSRSGRMTFRRSSGFAGAGFMNPDLMVMTSQSVMHRDAAARLGLPGIPITGSPEGRPGR